MTSTQSLYADLIASTTHPCGLPRTVQLSPYIIAEAGYVVAVRALEEKDTYNEVECSDGTFRTITAGQVLVGVLGERHALKGYSGHVPATVAVGDTLHVLNLGGILGHCTSAVPALGEALRVEVLGAVMTQHGAQTVHARIQDGALPPADSLPASAPLVIVSGTAMDTGKTAAASALVEGLAAAGHTVAAAKLTGASLMRDVQAMKAGGAAEVATFTDAGVVCSTQGDIVPVAKGIIQHLNDADPDVIVLELGDGIVGDYGVDDLLADQEIQKHAAAHVVTATDLAGAWAAHTLFQNHFQAKITVMTGPVTDNAVGSRFIETKFGMPAANAIQQPRKLVDTVMKTLPAPQQPPVPAIHAPSPAAGSTAGSTALPVPNVHRTHLNGSA
jgi:hypothetical protein